MLTKLIYNEKGTEYDFNWQRGGDKTYFKILASSFFKMYICGYDIHKIYDYQRK